MTPARLEALMDLPPAARQAVCDRCNQFEEALGGGGRVRAEDYFDPSAPGATVLLQELLILECEVRLRRGDPVSPDELSRRFPDYPRVVDGLVDVARSYAAAAPDGLCHDDGTPMVVGPYRLRRELGRGGFGVVFLATEIATGDDVAVKIPHAPVLLTPGLRDWFDREAQAARQLDHPHIVRFVAAGEAGLVWYLATEYVPGPSLAEWLRSAAAAVDPAAAADLLLCLASAVEHAHSRGVLHRDLKPGNVLLEGGSLRAPKLADFGTARLADAPELTRTGVAIGTPAYMAPEQAAGRRDDVSERTDVYGLGAILYELLTGRPPFSGSTVDVFRQVMSDPPVRPRALAPAVPRGLQAVCLKCLEKSPARRYASAGALADDLRRFVSGRRVRARSPGPLRRSGWWVRRHPVAGVAALAALLMGVAGMLGLALHARRLEAANGDLTRALGERDASNRRLRRVVYADAIRRAGALLDRGQVEGARRLLADWDPAAGEEDLRGWEWYYLSRRPGLAQTACRPVGTVIRALAFSPDGEVLAAAGDDGAVRLWDRAAAADVGPPLRHPSAVEYLAWTPDGKHLVTCDADGRVRTWPRDGGPPVEFPGRAGRVASFAVSPDGRTVATGGVDGAVRVWALGPHPTAPRTLARDRESARAVAFAAAGASLVVAWGAGPPRVVDVGTGRVQGELTGPPGSLAVALLADPSGGRITCVERQGVAVWDWDPRTNSGRFRYRLPGQEPRLNGAAAGPDGRSLATAGAGPVKVWDVDRAQLRFQLIGHEGEVRAAAVSPGGAELVSAGADGTVRVWDLRAAAAEEPLVLTGGGFRRRVALVGAGPRVAAVRKRPGTEIEVWEWGAGGPRCVDRVPVPPLKRLDAVGDGRSVLARDAGDRVVRFDLGGGAAGPARAGPVTVTDPLPTAPTDFPQPSARGPGDSWAVAYGRDIRGGGPAWPRPGLVLSGPRSPITALAFGPDGSSLLSAGKDGISVWNLGQGAERSVVPGIPNTIEALAFDPGGGFAAGGDDQIVRLWDDHYVERLALVGHRGRVETLGYAADGRTLVSGGDEGDVRLWRVDSGSELLVLPQTGALWYAAFSSDGRYLVYARQGEHDPNAIVIHVCDCGRSLSYGR